MLKENTSLDHGHLQVHNELKPSNVRVISQYKWVIYRVQGEAEDEG